MSQSEFFKNNPCFGWEAYDPKDYLQEPYKALNSIQLLARAASMYHTHTSYLRHIPPTRV